MSWRQQPLPFGFWSSARPGSYLVQDTGVWTGSGGRVGSDVALYPSPPTPSLQAQNYCDGGVAELKVRVRWTDPAEAAGWYAMIYREDAPGGGYEHLDTIPASAGNLRTWYDTGAEVPLSPAPEVRYRIRYVDGDPGDYYTGYGSSASVDLSGAVCVSGPSLSVSNASFCQTSGNTDVYRLLVDWSGPPGGWEVEVQWGTNGSSYPNSLYTGTGGSTHHTRSKGAAATYYRARFRRANSNAPGGYDLTGWATASGQVPGTYICAPLPPVVTFNDLSGCSVGYDRVVDFQISVAANSPGINETEVWADLDRIVYVGGGTVNNYHPDPTYRTQGRQFRVVHTRDGQASEVLATFNTNVTCNEPYPSNASASALGGGLVRVGWTNNYADSTLTISIRRYDGIGDANDPNSWQEVQQLAYNATSWDDYPFGSGPFKYSVQYLNSWYSSMYAVTGQVYP